MKCFEKVTAGIIWDEVAFMTPPILFIVMFILTRAKCYKAFNARNL
jgi:hypothetical protein